MLEKRNFYINGKWVKPKNQKDIEVFWFSKSKKLYEKLKKEGIDCVYVYSYSGI